MKQQYKAVIAGLVIIAVSFAGCANAPQPFGDMPYGSSREPWVALIDGDKGLENFTRLGDTNWLAMHGAIQADRKNGASKDAGILLSKNSYTDFHLYTEFWAESADTNSGIYIRVMNRKMVNTKASYEVQIWDNSPGMATASLMPPAKVAPSPPFRAAGRWNTMEVIAKGPQMIVIMNGEKAVDVSDAKFTSGPIALQYNSGIIKFRKLLIRPL